MKLRYITCSDIKEHIPVDKVVDLLKFSPKVEIGIQAHFPEMKNDSPRNFWLQQILNTSDLMQQPLNIAIHVNYAWCSDFCQGIIPQELKLLLNRKHKGTGKPIIKRWQLNLGDGTKIPNTYPLSQIILSYPNQEFIFPYNENPYLQNFIENLDKTGIRFSILFDASYGAGISPKNWQRPLYSDHYQGYAGGLSPENVTENLDKIFKLTGKRSDIWIDAEGKLMKPGTRIFDLERAENYIKNALSWEQKQK